jgi:predicted nuclease of predicted toxin-antitoxin system
MRFVIDAQLPPGLATHLTQLGHAAEHVNRIGLGAAGDEAIWSYALRTRAVLLTKDEDFVALARRQSVGQVVWIRIGNIGNNALWTAISAVLTEIIESLENGERIVEVV